MMKSLLIIFITLVFSKMLFADSCKIQEPVGIDLIQLESQYSSDLSVTIFSKMLDRAEVLGQSNENTNKIAALLLLHKIQERSINSNELTSSLVLLSKQRASVVKMLQYWPHYKCHEFKAARDYVNKYPLGYRSAEIWGSWIYEPVEFIESRIRDFTKENRLKVMFFTFLDVDPCNSYQYDNSCYALTFSEIADESANTEIWHDTLFTAIIFNLDLSVCEFATDKEREVGLNAATRHTKLLEENFPTSVENSKVKKFIALRNQNKYKRKELYSNSCSNYNDN